MHGRTRISALAHCTDDQKATVAGFHEKYALLLTCIEEGAIDFNFARKSPESIAVSDGHIDPITKLLGNCRSKTNALAWNFQGGLIHPRRDGISYAERKHHV